MHKQPTKYARTTVRAVAKDRPARPAGRSLTRPAVGRRSHELRRHHSVPFQLLAGGEIKDEAHIRIALLHRRVHNRG